MTIRLKEFSDTLAAAVDAAGAGVVRVEGRRPIPASGIVWSAEGVIVTAHHVVRSEEGIVVGLPDGRDVPAQFVGRDPGTDIAVLRMEERGEKVPEWKDPQEIKVGQLALALGRPGKGIQASLGIVAAFGGEWQTFAGGKVEHYLQPDIVMYPGFSGGPLIGADGEVLGILTSALMRGISVAIPALTVRRVVESLLTHGRVRRGFLGVAAQVVNLPRTFAEKVSGETGLLVVAVESGSPAEEAGMLLGDTIVEVDGQPMRRTEDLLAVLSKDVAGKKMVVNLVRGGEWKSLSVKAGER